MPDLDGFFGRNVSYSKEKFEIYQRLLDDHLSPFRKKTMSEIFVYAAIFGFKNNRREKIKEDVPNISVAAFTDKQKAILLSLAIQVKDDVDILFNSSDTSKIINEYANGGIEILEYELIGDGHGADAITKMASTIRNCSIE